MLSIAADADATLPLHDCYVYATLLMRCFYILLLILRRFQVADSH